MTPRVVPELERRNGRSSYGEFRSRGGATTTSFASRESVFWKYMCEPAVLAPVASEFTGQPRLATMDDAEQRVLSRATSAAGDYLVPSDFDEMVSSVRVLALWLAAWHARS